MGSGPNSNSSNLVTCKNEDPSKNEGIREVTTFLPLKVYCPILPNSELIQDFMIGIITCKNEEDPYKKEGARLVTLFFPL